MAVTSSDLLASGFTGLQANTIVSFYAGSGTVQNLLGSGLSVSEATCIARSVTATLQPSDYFGAGFSAVQVSVLLALSVGGALRIAAHYNKFPATTTTHTGTKLHGVTKYPVYIGSANYSSLAATFWNKRLITSGDATSNANAVTIEEVWLESRNASTTNQAKQMKFSGSNSRVMASGEMDVITDELLPSAFGLSTFTQGDLYFIVTHWSVALATNTIMTSRFYNEGDGIDTLGTSRFRAWEFDSAVTTLDLSVAGGNTPTVTGSALTTPSSQRGLTPWIVGRRTAAGKKHYLLTADSIGDRTYGYLRASCLASSLGIQANAELSISGGHQSDLLWIPNSIWKYANVWMDGMGINNVTDKATSWNILFPLARTNSIAKIVKAKLTPSTFDAQNATSSVTYVGSGGVTDVTVNTGATLPGVGEFIGLAGATPAGLNAPIGGWQVLTSGAGAFTYQVPSNLGSGSATGTIVWSGNWSKEASQTYQQGGAGGNAGAFNDAMQAYKDGGTIDTLLEVAALHGVDAYKWKATQPSYVTDTWVDGTTQGRHPTAAAAAAAAAEIAPIIDALVVA